MFYQKFMQAGLGDLQSVFIGFLDHKIVFFFLVGQSHQIGVACFLSIDFCEFKLDYPGA